MRKRHFTRQVGLILPEETYNQVIEETNKKEVTISEWIREAIYMWLNRGKRSIDLSHYLKNNNHK